jgi:drug/metabolite transporter (DMT)-like permease
MREEAVGVLFVALASVEFGVVVVLGKVAQNRGVPTQTMLAVRFGVAALVMAAVLAAARRPLRAARGERIPLVLLGLFGYAVEATLFFFAVGRGTASAATLLFFSYPVIVAVLSAALGRGVPGALLGVALGAAVSGTALVALSSGGIDITHAGIVFAITSATVYSLYLLFVERVLRDTPSITGAMWVSAAAASGLSLVAFVSGTAWPHGARQWWPVVGMGVATAGAFIALFAGIRRVGAVRTSIVAALEPLSTAIIAAIALDERLRARTLFGSALILAGAILAGLARSERRETEVPV